MNPRGAAICEALYRGDYYKGEMMPRAQDLLEHSTTRFDRRRFLQLTGTLAGAVAFSQLRADLGAVRVS